MKWNPYTRNYMPSSWKCPKCGEYTEDWPAVTRDSNASYREICSDCGTREAIESFHKWKQQEMFEDEKSKYNSLC